MDPGLAECPVFVGNAGDGVPDNGADPLGEHIRHKLELLCELETAFEGSLDEFFLGFLDLSLDSGQLKLEIVGVKSPHERVCVAENGLGVAIVDDLLLGQTEL